MKNSIKNAFGAVPQRFSDRIDETLMRLPEQNADAAELTERLPKAQRTGKMWKLPLIAAMLILVLGTALAVGSHYGILDFMNGKPDDNAQNVIAANPASGQKNGFVCTVREAVYDGTLLRYVLAVEAEDSEHFVPVSEHNSEFELMNGDETVGEYAARTGKELLNVGFLHPDIEGYGVETGLEEVKYEGETLVLYGEYTVPPRILDDPIRVFFTSTNPNSESSAEEVIVSFFLNKTSEDKRTYHVRQSRDSVFQVAKAELIRTDFSDYFVVEYSLDKYVTAAASALYDAETTYYTTSMGRYAHVDEFCSGMQGAYAAGKAELLSKGKLPCPVCMGNISIAESLYNPYWLMDIVLWDTPDQGIFYHRDSDDMLLTANGSFDIDVRGSRVSVGESEVVRYVIMFERGAMPEGQLLLSAYDPDGNRYEPVVLE